MWCELCNIPGRLLIETVLIALLLSASSCVLARDAEMKLYVSPQGNDNFTGRLAEPGRSDGPFATIARAQAQVQALKQAGQIPAGGIIIEFAGGFYELDKALNFGPEDSGTFSAPIVYRARKGETPRIIGGRVVDGWQPVRDRAILDKLDPATRGKVMQVDLKAQGINDFGEIKSAEVWANSDPGIELFFNDNPMTVSRYPNEGYMYIADVSNYDGQQIFGIQGSSKGQFTCDDPRITRWVNDKDIMLHGYWFWDWADQRYKVNAISAEKKEFDLDAPHASYGFRKGQWFYAYNILSELDKPGEWYLDRDTGILYFWPPEKIKPGSTMVSITRGLITAKDCENIRFEHLTFECARGNAFVIEDGRNIQIRGCTIRNLGDNAVRITGGRQHEVIGCDIYNMGNGGIALTGGDRPTLTAARHRAENNQVHHCSRWNPLYHPGIELWGVGNIARNNLLHHLPHIAINFTGNDQVVEYNEIHNVCTQANDCGAIYTSPPDEDWTMRGHQIRFNFLHHLYGFENRGCQGIYLDDAFSSANIYGNILWRVPNGILIGGGRDNNLENNIFFECRQAFSIDCRGLGWMAGNRPYLMQKLSEMPWQEPLWQSRYPEMNSLLEGDPMVPVGNKLLHNICWQTPWGWIEEPVKPHIEQAGNLIDQDPKFADAAKGNFTLSEDSPAFASGYKPIALEKIGLQRSRWRASWPVAHPADVLPEPPKPQPPKPQPHPKAKATIEKITSAPVIDGSLKDNEWPGQPLLLAETPERTLITGEPVQAWITHDGATLYVALRVPLKNPDSLDLANAWGRSDGAEIVFRDTSEEPVGPGFCLQGYPTGVHNGTVHAGASPEAVAKLDAGVKFTANTTKDAWIAEWAIPLSAADIKYKKNMKLGWNMGVRRTETNEWLVWAGTFGPTFNLDNSGMITLK